MILPRQRNFTKIGKQKKFLGKVIEYASTDPEKAKRYTKLVNNSHRMTKAAPKMNSAANKAVDRAAAKTGLSREEIIDNVSKIVG